MDLWATFIIISISHSLFVIGLLIYQRQLLKSSGKWLILLLAALLWLQVEFLMIRWPFNVGVNIFYGTRHGSWLALGPLFYLYVKSLSQQVTKKDLIHLMPFALFCILIPVLSEDFLSFRQVHYGMLTPFDRWPDTISAKQYLYSYVFIGQFFHVICYLFLAKQLIKKSEKSLLQSRSELSSSNISLLKLMQSGMLIIVLVSSAFIVLLFFTEVYRRHFDYLYVLPISFLIYSLSYRLYRLNLEPLGKSSYSKSGLKKEESILYQQRLEQLISSEKLYRQQSLKLSHVANKLDISPHKLSQVLNQQMKCTFFDFINKYRVEEAKKLMLENPNYKLLHIAFESGFNNKTSFVNAFKKFEGMTPSKYMQLAS